MLATQSYPHLANDQRLDNRIWVTTPEQIRFRYNTVGALRRFSAFALDMIFMFSGLGLFIFTIWLLFLLLSNLLQLNSTMAELMGGFSVFLTVVSVFVVYWLSSAGQEYFFNGATFGKRICGIRAVSLDGRPPSIAQCFGRNFLRLADGLPLFPVVYLFPQETTVEMVSQIFVLPTFLAGLISMMVTQRFQRIGDLFAGTMVVENEKYEVANVPVFKDRELLTLALKIPMDFHPTREMLETLSLYVGRRMGFHHQRRLQMASHLAQPLVKQWNLPSDTNYDLLMGALYVRSVCEYSQVESMLEEVEAGHRNQAFLNAGNSAGNQVPPVRTFMESQTGQGVTR